MASKRKWSGAVTENSDAMDVAEGTFRQSDPKAIARAVEHDAEVSTRRKSSPYASAMSMLTFYINRAGKNLTAKQRKVFEDAKDVLRAEFGPGSARATKAGVKKVGVKKGGVKKTAAKKTSAKKGVVKKAGAKKKR